MNRIEKLFKNKANNILSLYFCAGYPNLNATRNTLLAIQEEKIDMVEIGIPFSDPIADGSVIQDAATKSLANGMSLKTLFEQLEGIRKEVEIPIILMGYYNPIFHYGTGNFFSKCNEIGIDGVIIPDLPYYDYITDIKKCADKNNVKVIMLITPETTDQRILDIDNNTSGFIYMVSTASTTGTQSSYCEKTLQYFERVQKLNLKNKCLIGFGISNKATLQAANNHASGAIIGSAFVKELAKNANNPSAAVQSLKSKLEE